MLPEEKIIEAYNAYGREIFTYLARLLGNGEIATDLLQDCFVRLIEYSRTREVRTDTLRAFLYRTAHNLAINHMKKMENREKSAIDDRTVAAGGDPGESLERLELAAAIRDAMMGLDETTRSLYVMRRELSMELREIAETMGMSEKTVRRKIAGGMEAMMRELKKKGFTP